MPPIANYRTFGVGGFSIVRYGTPGVGGTPYSAVGHRGLLPHSAALCSVCSSLSSDVSLRIIPAPVGPFAFALGFHSGDICTSIFRAIFHPFLFGEGSIPALSACSALSLPREVLIFFSTPKLIAQRSQRAGWNEGTRVQYGFLSNKWVQRPGLRLSRAGKRCECNRRRFLLRTH